MPELLDRSDIVIAIGQGSSSAGGWRYERIAETFNRLPDKQGFSDYLVIARELLRKINGDTNTEFLILAEFNDNEIAARQLLSLLISNAFNIADARLEAGECSGPDDKKAFGGFSFNQAVSAIEKIAELTEERLPHFRQETDGILKAQWQGLKLVRKSKKAGRITYSVDEAMANRWATVGAYYQLLAKIGIDKPESHRSFIDYLMAQIQCRDDKDDLSEDLDTQVNPFLAAIAELGLEPLLRKQAAHSLSCISLSIFKENPKLSREQRRALNKSFDEISWRYRL